MSTTINTAYECFVNLHCVIKKDINRDKQKYAPMVWRNPDFFKQKKQGPVGFQTKEVPAMSRLSSIEELEKTGPAVWGWGGWDLGGMRPETA